LSDSLLVPMSGDAPPSPILRSTVIGKVRQLRREIQAPQAELDWTREALDP